MRHDRWPIQIAGVNGVLAARDQGYVRIALTSPTGTGKTTMIGDLAETCLDEGGRVLIYTNRKLLLEQAASVFAEQGFEFGIRAAGHGMDHDQRMQISSIHTERARVLDKGSWEHFKADLVIVDECFVPETLVTTTSGNRRIDLVRPGDKVTTACGVGTVEMVSCRAAPDLVRVELSDGSSITCTRNHPIFTGRGWVRACSLEVGESTYCPEAMRVLWESVWTEDDPRERRKTGSSRRSPVQSPTSLLKILLEEIEEPDEQQPGKAQDESQTQRDHAQAHKERRQRAIAALSTASSFARSGRRVGIGGGNPTRKATKAGAPNLLQTGHSQQGEEDRDRSRRHEPYDSGETGARCEKNGVSCGPRVVSVSRVKFTGTQPVFNLRVSGHPSYFANGILAHNCHQMLTDAFRDLSSLHVDDGATIVGVTATPIGLKDYYDTLVVAGVTSDGRNCGALVPARHFGCGEPDLRLIGPIKIGEDLSENQNRKAIMVNGIFGRVLKEFNRLNPEHKPTILFAPGVKDSIWFAEQFNKAGVSAAHIDGENVWINGKLFRSDPEARQAILQGSKDGRIKVLCNRFVLREGIDAPWLCHGIFATVFGSLQSYLQSGGRLLRSHPNVSSVTIQDHGGNWWRHGSLNADRHWSIDDTASSVVAKRAELLRDKKEKEPLCCPQCGLILMSLKCVCGFVVDPRKKSRVVIQSDGTLREHYGDIFPPRVTRQEPDTASLWQKIYWRARASKKGMSFLQAEGLFLIEHGYYPPRDLPYMPKDSADWFKTVKNVKRNSLL